MRRFLPFVVLVVSIWPHLAVMRCATTPVHAGHDHHEASMHDRHEASMMESQHSHDAPDCPAIMACSAAMMEGTVEVGLAVLPHPPVLFAAVSVAAPETVDLASEPPPPRRIA